MKLGIQRRNILLTPPQGMDVTWLTRQLRTPEIEENFAWGDALGASDVIAAHRVGSVVIGIIRRVTENDRIGFALMLPPHEGKDFFELLAAIPQKRHRDAFSMVHAIDAMSHYMFEHLGADRCGATVRPENRASLAVVKRIGYQQRELRADAAGVMHAIYVLDRATWVARRARLERGEAQHPSSAGSVFVVKPR